MNDNPSPASGPGNAHDVNVTVNVNTAQSSGDAPSALSLLTILGYVALGLLAIGFAVGQLVIGGNVSITFP